MNWSSIWVSDKTLVHIQIQLPIFLIVKNRAIIGDTCVDGLSSVNHGHWWVKWRVLALQVPKSQISIEGLSLPWNVHTNMWNISPYRLALENKNTKDFGLPHWSKRFALTNIYSTPNCLILHVSDIYQPILKIIPFRTQKPRKLLIPPDQP